MKTIIDVCMDHVPESLFDSEELLNGFISSAPRAYGEIASVATLESGKRQLKLEKPRGCQNLNYVEGDYSLEVKLEAMNASGVDKAFIRMPVWQEWLTAELCRRVNDDAADIGRRSGGRLLPVACVPPWGGKENIYELERCVKELGMTAVQLACHYGNLYLDDEAFKPMLRVINELELPVYVRHCAMPVQWESIYDYTNLRRSVGRVIDQATAVGRELFSGMFEEFPKLKFIHTLLGGNWYSNYHNTIPQKPKTAEAMLRLDTNDGYRIQGYLKNNLYFEATHAHTFGKDAIECAIKICGAENVLFGSSFPVFYSWLPDGVEFMKSLDITEDEYDLVMGGNAARLFMLD